MRSKEAIQADLDETWNEINLLDTKIQGLYDRELTLRLALQAVVNAVEPADGQLWVDQNGVLRLISSCLDACCEFAGIDSDGNWVDFSKTWTYHGQCTGFKGDCDAAD